MKYLKLMRVKHWLKNVLVFAAVVFGGKLFDFESMAYCLCAFGIFSLAASVVYVINDMADVEKDRLHPVKCNRPIASGQVSFFQARILMGILLVLIIMLNYYTLNSLESWIIIIGYIVLNIIYSKGAKNIALLDLGILVLGYILRIYYGALVIDVEISGWLYLTITFAAFYMSLGKRRNELLTLGKDSRKVLKFYTKDFLDKNMYMCLSLTLMCYAYWCEIVNTSRNNGKMLLTVPLVMIICMRYSMDVEASSSDGDPMNVILSDKILIGLGGVYGILLICFLYC